MSLRRFNDRFKILVGDEITKCIVKINCRFSISFSVIYIIICYILYDRRDGYGKYH